MRTWLFISLALFASGSELRHSRLRARSGGPGTGANPEQLLAAGWSACFESAMGLAARTRKIALPADFAIDAEVDLNLAGGDDYFLRARLNVSVPGLDRAVAQELVDAGEMICPYSKALKGSIDVTVTLV